MRFEPGKRKTATTLLAMSHTCGIKLNTRSNMEIEWLCVFVYIVYGVYSSVVGASSYWTRNLKQKYRWNGIGLQLVRRTKRDEGKESNEYLWLDYNWINNDVIRCNVQFSMMKVDRHFFLFLFGSIQISSTLQFVYIEIS